MYTWKQRIFTALVLLILLSTASVFAQNLIVNGDFENSNQLLGYETDYEYYGPPPYLTEPGVYVVKRNPNLFHNQWFDMGDHTSGGGRFFIANGKGYLSNYRVWATTVNVTPNTTYSFSFWATHISNGNGMATSRAKFRVTINGSVVGTDNWQPQFVSGGYWDQYPAATWNSGTATTATIIIYDRCALDSGYGDDFGIDDISFVPDETYSVTANNDTYPLACLWMPVEIPVLDNDVILPNAQQATVTIIQQPSHGGSTVLTNKHIEYIFNDETYTGTTDQLKYRVSLPGQNLQDDAWVYITIGRSPSVAIITAPNAICAGGSLGIPTPSVTPEAPGHWEYGNSETGSFTTFDPNNIPLSMNGKYVRYSTSNDCGEGHSNAVQITVTTGPSFTGQTFIFLFKTL